MTYFTSPLSDAHGKKLKKGFYSDGEKIYFLDLNQHIDKRAIRAYEANSCLQIVTPNRLKLGFIPKNLSPVNPNDFLKEKRDLELRVHGELFQLEAFIERYHSKSKSRK